jgi:pSer/pThr/pTyr-binding forkhead associated (FHA) protein
MGNALKKWEASASPSTEHTLKYTLEGVYGLVEGKTFKLDSKRTVIGRSKECQIHIEDSKISRKHAEIVLYQNRFVISDLDSQNGIYINEQKVKQSELKVGDELTIGHNVLRLVGEVKKPELEEFNFTSDEPKTPKNKRGMFLILGGVLLGLLLLGEGENEQSEKTSDTSGRRYDMSDINSDLIKTIRKRNKKKNKELAKKIDTLLKRGLRELREQNYFRAMSEFNHALDLDPKDAQANFYLRRAREMLDDAIREYNVNAVRDLESLRYRRAIISYCSIIRLLHRYPNDKRYKDAKEKIITLEENLGYEKGEISCIQK